MICHDLIETNAVFAYFWNLVHQYSYLLIIPPVYEVYSFCLFRNNVCLCVCVCKLFFFAKDFSGTTAPRILKFGTNVGFDLLYCVRQNQPPTLTIPFFVLFSFSPIKISVTDFSAPMRARVFKFCIHLQSGQVYCGKENQDAEFHFCLLFPFFHLSL